MPAEVSEGERTIVPPAEPPLAIEAAPPALPPDESLTHRCANCLTPLAGPFCAQCGQHVADYHRSIWRFVADFFDNVLCWDSKILRTLGPLLKRPGWLTQEFMAGRRVRYVHPLRLFLFTSAICLTLLQYTHHLANARVRVDRAANVKPGASVPPGTNDDDDDDAAKPTASPAPAASAASAAPGATASPGESLARPSASPAPSTSQASLGQVFRETFKDGKPRDAEAAKKLGQQLDTIGNEIERKVDAAGGARAFSDKMTNNIQQKLSYVALAMLPIFALLMRWAYGRSGGYYFTYLVFSLHYHTFLLMFWVAYSCVDAMANHVNKALFEIPGLLVGLCLLVPPFYLYRALRQMYGQSRFATAAKVCAIGALHLLALFAGLAIIGATSFL